MAGFFGLGQSAPTPNSGLPSSSASIGGAEPSLEAALGQLTADEAADFKTWGSPEKLQFLAAYQYVAVMTASGLRRPDGTPFNGLLSQGVSLGLVALQDAIPYTKQMAPADAQSLDQLASVLKEASTATQPKCNAFVQKYLLLRDRVVWELWNQYQITIQYEEVGTNPANPGVIFSHTLGANFSNPDYSAVFSTRPPAQLWKDGLALEDKFEALGVSFQRLNLSGSKRLMGTGPGLILGVLITLVVAILSFYWLWNHVNQQNNLLKVSADLIQADPSLTESQKAAKISQLRATNSFFNEILGGSDIPWVTLLVVVGLGILAYLAYPYIVDRNHKPYLAGGEA
jgi:hypothetical protein